MVLRKVTQNEIALGLNEKEEYLSTSKPQGGQISSLDTPPCMVCMDRGPQHLLPHLTNPFWFVLH